MSILTMRMIWILTLTLAALTSSCTKKTAPPEAWLKQRPFLFDAEATSELTLSKADAQRGDFWTARVVPDSASSTHHPRWNIDLAPQDQKLLDRRADGRWVAHLLDTFRTIEVTGIAPEGPLRNFGLEPPLFTLQWKEGSRGGKFEIGDPSPDGGHYARLIQTTAKPDHATLPSPVVEIRGASIGILGHLHQFERLRLQRLFTLEKDDVDLIEVQFGKASPQKYERQGVDWKDLRTGKLSKRPVDQWLEAMVHLRIQDFVDDPKEAKRIREVHFPKKTLYRIEFTNREDLKSELQVAKEGDAYWAILSSRPEGVYRLYPESRPHFELLKP